MNKKITAFLLLAVAAATRVSSSRTPSSAPVPAPAPAITYGDENIALIIPAEMMSLNLGSCITELLETGGCVVDTARTMFSRQFKISPKCCTAIEGLGEQCLGNPPFFKIVRSLCALIA